jgi:hypothetical protein
MTNARNVSKILNLMNLETNKVVSSAYDSDSISTSINKGAVTPVGTITASSADALPVSPAIGTQAVVTLTGRFYIFNGSGWYNIATVNSTPYWDSEAAASYTLPTDGTSIVVEVLASDSDGTAITYTATGDSNFNTIATVAKDSDNGRRFIIRSIDSEGSASPTGGTGVLTFRASDGIDQASTASTFSINFAPNWSGATLITTTIDNMATADGDRYGGNITQSGNGEYWATIGKTNGAAELRIFKGKTSSPTQEFAGVSPAGSGDYGQTMDMNFDGDALIIASSGSNSHKKAYIYTRSGSTWSLAYTDNGDSLSGTVYPCQGTRLSGTGLNQRAFFRYLSNRVRVLVTTDGWATSSQEAMIDWGSNNSNAIGDIAVTKDGSRLVQSYANATTTLSQIGQLKVWSRSGSTWTLEDTLDETSPVIYAGLGQNVAIAADNGDVIIASKKEEGDFNQGGVVVFTRSGSTWSQSQEFSPITSNPGYQPLVGIAAQNGRKGIDISGDGSTMVVAYPKKTAVQSNGGSFYILSGSSGSYTISHTVDNTASDPYSRQFGASVSISQDASTIAVGILDYDEGTYTNSGAVNLYTI